MKRSEFVISQNRMIADRTYMMMLVGETDGILPGQFVMIEMPELFLRRPISVCDCHPGLLTLVYKVVGEGTQKMAEMTEGTVLNIITGLGNGYRHPQAPSEEGDVLLVGGGVGVPPLFYLARMLKTPQPSAGGGVATTPNVKVVLGFNSINEVFAVEDFKRLGCEVVVCTADGSYGVKGFVTDVLEGASGTSSSSGASSSSSFGSSSPYYYACGPLPMLKALVKTIGTNGQVSMEERMGCGFGICVGCSLETKKGVKRVCKEGPVFPADEIAW